MAESDIENDSKSKPLVVFIHGIAAPRFVFLFLKWHMWRKGYRTKIHGYRSVFKTIPHHADRFVNRLQRIENDPTVGKFHIVAHSMGGIVTRQALLNYRPEKLGRVLMLATPNKGSATARILSDGIFRFSKTLRQISDADESFVRQLGFPNGIEVGAIHANVDRVVTRESCRPTEESPFLEIASGHNDLLFRPATASAVVRFLKTGSFQDYSAECHKKSRFD